MNAEDKKPLIGMDIAGLRAVAAECGLPAFAAKQIAHWIYGKRVDSIDAMTDLSKRGREALAAGWCVGRETPKACSRSTDGTAKYLFRGAGGRDIEAVYIPDRDRATLCVSSQAGCRMGCTFCMTGRQGFHGNLSAAQIVNQILSIPESDSLTNIVFMGMGEPLDNFDAVLAATRVLTESWGLAWSPKRITVSTVGHLPSLRRLLAESKVHVALSVHTPFADERAGMMPVEKAWPVADVMAVLREYDFAHQRRLSVEYTMWRGINDDMRHADALARLLRGSSARANLSERLIRVGITHGDINGIGYEVILKTLDDTRILEMCTPVVYGSAKIAAFYRKTLGMQPVQLTQTADAADARDGAVNIINVVGEDCKVEPGQETATAGEAARAALERAVADLRKGHIDVLVTAPINKHNVHSAEFAFPGHTEYLEASLGCDDGSRALMVLCSDDMRVALVTTHLPINQVPQAITREAVLEKLRLFNRSLVRDFGVHAPRIAVLSLNPHAGEGGLLGTEEQEAISPAIEDARGAKILAFGPYAADGFFGSGLYHRFDGVLAMYHDQGLAPFKALAMEAGVNFTAGLPYVRTSPDHGTGYDIAGKGEASEQSMRSAIFTAIDIYRNRLREDEATAHPLRRQYFNKGNDNVVLDLS